MGEPHIRAARFSRVRRVSIVGLGILAGIALAVAFSGRAHASSTIDATITGPGGGSGKASCIFSSLTSDDYSQAVSDLAAAEASGCSPSYLPVGSSGFATLAVPSLSVYADSTTNTIYLEGTATVLGQPTTVLVVGQWTTSTSTPPTYSLIMNVSGSLSLSSFFSGAPSSFDLPLTNAWIGTTTSANSVTIDPSTFPVSSAPYLSGFLSSPMTISPGGLSFQATPTTTGAVASTLTNLGVDPGSILLQGNLSGSVGNFPSTAPSVSSSFSLSASFSDTAAPLAGITFNSAATLSVTGASDGTWAVTINDTGNFALGQMSLPVSTTETLSGTPSAITIGLDANLGTVSNAFGLSWLTLNSADVAATVTDSAGTLSATGNVTASVTLGSSPADTFNFTESLDTTSGFSASLTTTASLTTSGILADFGLSLPPGAPDVSIGGLGIAIQISTSHDVTLAVSGTASVTFITGGPSLGVDLLVRVDNATTASPDVLVAARVAKSQNETLGELLGTSITPDFTLPDFAVTVSNSAIDNVASTSLDPITEAYFAATQCNGAADCAYSLNVPQGVGLTTSVTLPSSVASLFDNLTNSTITGPVVIEGQLPVLGASATSLTVQLPTITPASGTVRQIDLAMVLQSDAGSFSFSVQGDLTLTVPGQGGTPCPSGVSVDQTTYACIDVTVSATISEKAGNLAITLEGQLSAGQGWTLNDPSWLTIDALTVKIGVQSGDTGAGLTIGMRGSVSIGSATNLTVAFDLQLSPEAPWIEPLGFTIASGPGISMADLASFYDSVTHQSIAPNSLPAVSLRNLYLSFMVPTAQADPALCLQPGLYISADLYLSNSANTDNSPPPCSPSSFDNADPSKSSQCRQDSTCLASVRLALDLSGTTPSISGSGYLAAGNVGPYYFDATSVSFELSSSVVQVDFSAGGTLKDPVVYATDVSNGTDPSSAPTWASGILTLDVGTQNLALDGSVTIGSLSASVNATGSLNLSNPGFNLTEWFNQAQQFFTNAGNTITTSVNSAATTASTWYNTYIVSGASNEFNALQNVYSAMTTGQADWSQLYAVYGQINTAVSKINSVLNKLDLSAFDLNADQIISDALHGLDIPSVQTCTKLGCITWFSGFHIPGVCDLDPVLHAQAICYEDFSSFIANAQAYFADPSVTASINGAGLTMPGSASSVVQRIHVLDPTSSSSVTCAMATANFGTGTESKTSVTVNSLGHDVTFQEPIPSTFAAADNLSSEQNAMDQSTFNGLYSGTNTGSCTPPSANLSVAALSLSLNHSWINEGDSVTATGYLTNSSATQVSVDWGDGSAPSIATLSNGQYTATHTYADETGASTSSPFQVTASVPHSSVVPAYQGLSVLDVPLTLNPVTFSTAANSSVTSVPIMTPVTISGSLNGFEPGEVATVSVDWTDGTTQSGTVNANGTFSFSHTYQQVAPVGAPSRVEAVTVNVAEPDGTSTSATPLLTVNDVAPSNTSSAFGSPSGGYFQSGSTVFAHTNDTIMVQGSAQSVTPLAGLLFQVTWGDKSSPSGAGPVSPTSGPDANGLYSYDYGPLSHQYTSACYDPVVTSVTDLDTMTGPSTQLNVVVTTPLGAKKRGPGSWENDIAKAQTGRGSLTTSQLQCYLDIAHFLAPSLPTTLAGATTVLSGATQDGLSGAPLAYAELQRDLLTSLLNFANGTWNWNQSVGPMATPFSTLVQNANTALGADDLNAMITATNALNPLN